MAMARKKAIIIPCCPPIAPPMSTSIAVRRPSRIAVLNMFDISAVSPRRLGTYATRPSATKG
jgi:hypothetical protein